MNRLYSLLIFLLLLSITGCGDKHQLSVFSPDKSLQMQLSLDEQGRAFYSVSKNGDVVVLPSQLGVELNTDVFLSQLKVTHISTDKVTQQYDMLHGKQKHIRYQANEKVFTVANAQGASLDLAVRVSNDGVAFQYRFPNPQNTLQIVQREVTQFAFPEQAKAWLQHVAVAQTGWSNTNPSYEEHYQMGIAVGTPSPSPAGWVFPALFKSGAHWVLVSEAGMNGDYHASRLQAQSPGGVYQLGVPMDAERFAVLGKQGALLAQAQHAFHSPWRLFLVGGLDTIISSTLGTDLADPAVATMDFVKPGVASWSWALLKDDSVNYDTQIEFIDYAAKMGWAYTLVDAEWDKRIGYERTAKLAAYAKSKNVGLLVWYNSAGDWNVTPQTPKSKLLTQADRRQEFARLQQMGVAGVKIDFFPGDGKSVMAYYNDLLHDAADFNLLVNFHGATLPRGLARTYPNLMTVEAVHGFEMITFNQSSADVAARHMAMLPFTRNAFDPMDFTPTTFAEIPNIQRHTSNGFELALPIVFLSGIQHIAETAENMAKAPSYVQNFMSDLPALWDESRLVQGFPGRYVIIARRQGARWFVAGINANDEDLSLTMDLSFAQGKHGKLIADGDNNRSFSTRELIASKSNALTIKAMGGFIVVLE